MPPKHKFTKQEILDKAFGLVRKKGWGNLSTRTLATVMETSARPIYSFFSAMDELEEELVKLSVDLLFSYMVVERTGDPWIDHGIGYVLFAWEEKYLFRGCNNEINISRFKKHGDVIWQKCTKSLSSYRPFMGLTKEQIDQIQFTRWLMTHGLAFQASNPPPVPMNNDFIVSTVQQGSLAILTGLKKQFSLQSP